MLILSRRIGETLVLSAGGHEIEITVKSVQGNQVKLSTKAPAAVTVDRKEIYERKVAGLPYP